MKKSKKNKKVILISLPFLMILILSLSTKASIALDKMTAEEGMKKITNLFYKYASKEEINRPVAYKTEDWPSNITRFIKMEKGELPIIGRPGFESSGRGTLEVAGVTKQGELLQFIKKTRIVSIPNPLSRRPDTSGIWYKVRMLNGVEGWIFVKPDSTRTPFASYFEKKVIPKTKPAPQTKPSGNKWFTDEDLKNLKTSLIILAVLVLFIIIVSSASKRKSTSRRPSSYQSSHSSGYSYDSSSSSSRQSASMTEETEEKEKAKSEADWPWKGKDVIIEDEKIKERGLIDVEVGKIEKGVFGEKEIRKDTIIGSKKVGEVKEDLFGTPKSIIDKKGNKIGDIKWRPFGPDIIVDKNRKKIGEYKDKDKSSDDNKSSSGCYLTAACAEAMGLPDNCVELAILRNFRDKIILTTTHGKKAVKDYYKIAPEIVQAIGEQKKEKEKMIWSSVYKDIRKAVYLIYSGDFEGAFKHYQQMTLKLKEKYID